MIVILIVVDVNILKGVMGNILKKLNGLYKISIAKYSEIQ